MGQVYILRDFRGHFVYYYEELLDGTGVYFEGLQSTLCLLLGPVTGWDRSIIWGISEHSLFIIRTSYWMGQDYNLHDMI